MTPCPFCIIGAARVVLENESAIAVLDTYPVTEGHTLVIPRRHVMSIYELDATEQGRLWVLVANARERLIVEHATSAFNIGFNDGFAAGQTVAHAHVHIIPRHHGDVHDPRGGIRWVIRNKAKYWND